MDYSLRMLHQEFLQDKMDKYSFLETIYCITECSCSFLSLSEELTANDLFDALDSGIQTHCILLTSLVADV